MIYRKNPRNGDEISQLGFGCMRFPRKSGKVDFEKAYELVCKAVESGINYFDTAYMYPGIEQALGEALERGGLRDRVKIATKLPTPFCKKSQDFDKLFDTQLERLRTDRIDYYLIHMLGDVQTFERLQAIGFNDWVSRKKSEGKIINIGFSFHGGREAFKSLIDAYDWDFTMIQYNYYDENNQASRMGLVYANQKGLPVFVMEPLLGGKLADKLPKAAKEVFRSHDENRTPVEWGLRWLWNQPEVTMLLSGMNELSQLEENVKLASSVRSNNLVESDLEVYNKALGEIKKSYKVPCTGCGYCMPCPQGLDIPTIFSCYNESFTAPFSTTMQRYFMTTGAITEKQKYASNCVKCGKCEKHCPQKIKISNELTGVSRKIESFWFRPVFATARKIMGIKNNK